MSRSAEIVICGAGIAGVSAAYYLARAGFKDILIVDPLPPLSLTSDRSTECYRNWWPDPEMVALMNRSIDLMEQLAEQSGNRLRMNRRGYLYVTANEAGLEDFQARAANVAALGAGPLRVHRSADSGYQQGAASGTNASSGADLLLDPGLIRECFPYLTDRARAALHVRRAGWLSAQQMGMYLLEEARRLGVQVQASAVEAVDTAGGRAHGVRLSSGEVVGCGTFIDAAGPYLAAVGQLLGVELPVRAELHLKVSFNDSLGVLDRAAPLLIWSDPQFLAWDAEERLALDAEDETRWLVEAFPAGVHVRPEGAADSRSILMLWDYRSRWMDAVFPVPLDEFYPEVALRGLTTMLPGLRRYIGRAPRPYMDGGYYMKTPDNRLLAGPLAVERAFVIGGLSGYGIMSSCAAGELLAAHVAGSGLPPYAAGFSPRRFEDPVYQQNIAAWDSSGDL